MSDRETSLQSAAGTNGAPESTSDDSTDPLHEQWMRSAEYARSRGRYLWLGIPGIVVTYAGIAVVFYSSTSTQIIHSQAQQTAAVTLGVAIAAIGVGLIGYAAAGRNQARAAFYARQERAARAGVDDALEQIESETDLRGLLRLNRRQMEAYEALTRRQAASSYRLSHLALAVGFGVVVAGAGAAQIAEAVPSKIAAAALAGIGATISGFIARTYLRIYERTLVQLNHYFEQPLVSSYVLTAERLIDKMSQNRRDDALSTLISELLVRLRGDAQPAVGDPLDSGRQAAGAPDGQLQARFGPANADAAQSATAPGHGRAFLQVPFWSVPIPPLEVALGPQTQVSRGRPARYRNAWNSAAPTDAVERVSARRRGATR